jgi:hypothetical protein
MNENQNSQVNKVPAGQPNIQDLIDKANEIYESLKAELEPKYNGKFVAIEIESKKHFIGDTRDEAVAEAKKEFPESVVFGKRIGGVEKSSRHSSYFPRYARLF